MKPELTKALSARKLHPSGAWQVSALIDGHLVTRTYYGYSKRRAVSEFRADTTMTRAVSRNVQRQR